MDRRKSIKSMILGSVAGGLVIHGCKPEAESTAEELESCRARFGGSSSAQRRAMEMFLNRTGWST
jgi:hypothetical protein